MSTYFVNQLSLSLRMGLLTGMKLFWCLCTIITFATSADVFGEHYIREPTVNNKVFKKIMNLGLLNVYYVFLLLDNFDANRTIVDCKF